MLFNCVVRTIVFCLIFIQQFCVASSYDYYAAKLSVERWIGSTGIPVPSYSLEQSNAKYLHGTLIFTLKLGGNDYIVKAHRTNDKDGIEKQDKMRLFIENNQISFPLNIKYFFPFFWTKIDGRVWSIQKKAEGKSLKEITKEYLDGKREFDELLKYYYDVGQAIATVHKIGQCENEPNRTFMSHNDLHIGNVLIHMDNVSFIDLDRMKTASSPCTKDLLSVIHNFIKIILDTAYQNKIPNFLSLNIKFLQGYVEEYGNYSVVYDILKLIPKTFYRDYKRMVESSSNSAAEPEPVTRKQADAILALMEQSIKDFTFNFERTLLN